MKLNDSQPDSYGADGKRGQDSYESCPVIYYPIINNI